MKLLLLIMLFSVQVLADQAQFYLENITLNSKDKNYLGTLETTTTANPALKYRYKIDNFHIEAGYKYLTFDKNLVDKNTLGLSEARLIYRFKPSNPIAFELGLGLEQGFTFQSVNGILSTKVLNLPKISVDYFKAFESIDDLMIIMDLGAEVQRDSAYIGSTAKIGLGFSKNLSKTQTLKFGYRFKYHYLKSIDIENRYKIDQFYILLNF